MERNNHRQHHQQPRRNPPSSHSSSLNQPSRRKPTRASHSNPTAATSNDDARPSMAPHVSDWRPRRRRSDTQRELPTKTEQEKEDEGASSFPTLTGTCPFMCPEGERAQRERLRDLVVFERLHGNPMKSSPDLAVKKFCRTISSKDTRASDVRPRPVLENTLTYLLSLLDSTDYPFEVVHDFIFDRTRSIRQDLSMQNIINDKAISMYEKMVKFHVVSHLKLRHSSGSSSISSAHYLNLEQLTKALTSLYNLYDANRSSNSVYGDEAEFRSLYVLLHLDSRNQPMGESLSLWFRHLPRPVIHSEKMCFARNVLRCFRMGNFKRFFCTVCAEASYLQYCIIESQINEIRALAISCLNSVGYKLHPYPLEHLSKVLIMRESDLESFCNACGLEVCTDDRGNKLLPAKQTTFCTPKGGFQACNFPGLEQFER